MWYMPMIIGYYIALPFISKVIHSEIAVNEYKIIYFGGIIAFFVIPTLNVFLREEMINIPKLGLQINVGFWGWILWSLPFGRLFYFEEKSYEEYQYYGSIRHNAFLFCI